MNHTWATDQSHNGPLDGLRVVDFSRIVSGPFATQILGDMGASVVKVEFVGIGDEVRSYGLSASDRSFNPAVDPGATFLAMNRNKRSLAIDVRTEQGREIVLKMIDDADVVVHNFRTGVMERLGIGYDDVSQRNEALIYCSISGFGSHGPLRDKPANDLIIQARSGLLSFTGSPATDDPVRNPTPICDMASGLYAVIGVLGALNHRERTGVGQHVETNMLSGQANMQNYILVDYWLNGIIPQKLGSGNRMGQPNQAFPTKDGWICIVASGQAAWASTCAALGLDHLISDPRFETLHDRYEHIDELVDALSEATRSMTTTECAELLEDAGVPSGPVYTIPEAVTDAQFRALAEAGGVVEMPVGSKENVKLVMTPIEMSGTPLSARLSPPGLGQHTVEILKGLGFDEHQIDDLVGKGVVGRAEAARNG